MSGRHATQVQVKLTPAEAAAVRASASAMGLSVPAFARWARLKAQPVEVEPLPPPGVKGSPRKPGAVALVYATFPPMALAELDEARGEETRTAYVRRLLMGGVRDARAASARGDLRAVQVEAARVVALEGLQ